MWGVKGPDQLGSVSKKDFDVCATWSLKGRGQIAGLGHQRGGRGKERPAAWNQDKGGMGAGRD